MEHLNKKIFILLLTVILIFTFLFVFTLPKRIKTNDKVILIGLDGAEWSIINHLISRGELPNITKLIQSGATGQLRSISPTISPALWTTIITGKERDKHGITDFFIKSPGEYEASPAISYSRKIRALWNILSENNKKVGVINWWASWPAEKVKGWLISNYPFSLTGNISQNRLSLKSISKTGITFPETLSKDVLIMADVSEDILKERVEFFLGQPLAELNLKSDKEKNQLRNLFFGIKETVGLSNISNYVKDKLNPDFLAVYFYALDGAQHIFWHEMEPAGKWKSGINIKEKHHFSKVIPNIYRAYDKIIGELLTADINITVIIISDHGFKADLAAKETNYNLNPIFEKLGWLKYKDDNPYQIDWIKTKVYDFNPLIWNPKRDIYINLEKRDPLGIVPEEELEVLKKQVKEALEQIKTIKGERVIKQSDILDAKQSPDLTVTLNISLKYQDALEIKGKKYSVDKLSLPELFTGQHTENGIIIMSGKNIKKGIKLEDANILDITPTILVLFGLPIAKDMEGKVLEDALEESFLKRNPISWVPTYEKKEKKTKAFLDNKQSEEYGLAVKRKLKDIGYIQ